MRLGGAKELVGRAEGQGLEFKRSDAIRSRRARRSLIKEIVAMLNSQEREGTIAVGFRDEGGRAVGMDPLTREEAERCTQALRDQLLDLIEPRIDLDWVGMELAEADGGVAVLLHVTSPDPDESLPFHVVDGDKRVFVKRHGDRVRPMTLEEIMRREGKHSAVNPATGAAARANLQSWWDGCMAELEGVEDPMMVLAVALGRTSEDDDLPLAEDAPAMIESPGAEVARQGGWTFEQSRKPPRWSGLRREEVVSGVQAPPYRYLRANRRGQLVFMTRLKDLQWEVPPNVPQEFPDAKGMLYPWSLVETVVSVLRLAGRIWATDPGQREVAGRMGMLNASGWLLPPYHPRAVGYMHMERWRMLDEGRLDTAVHRMRYASLQNSDALAFELLTDVYDRFGFQEESAIPCFSGDPPRFQPPE